MRLSGKSKKQSNINADIHLKASMTAEAAFVVPISLIVILTAAMFGFKLHDTVIGNMTANEAAELYNYMPRDSADDAVIEQYGEARLGNVLSDMSYSVDIEAKGDGSRVSLISDGKKRVYEAAWTRPENLMRKLTLIDAFTAEK